MNKFSTFFRRVDSADTKLPGSFCPSYRTGCYTVHSLNSADTVSR